MATAEFSKFAGILLPKDLSTKKDAQLDSCELKFYLGKIRTAVWEAAPHKALRNCSKEEGQYIRFW